MTSFEYPWALKRLFAGLSLSLALGACQEKTPATDDNAPVPLVAPKPADASDAGEIPADPNDAESLYFAGQQEFLNGNFAKAAEHFRSVILMEKSARAWHALGDVNMATMQFTAAVDAFGEAVKIEPGKRLSVMRLGQALQRGGRFGEAIEVYRQAQALKPEEADAYRLEAEALVPLQRVDEALERLSKAADLEKAAAQKAKDYRTMGELEVKREAMAKAAALFEKAIAVEPSVELYAALADAELRAGRMDKARDAFREAALRDAKDPFYWEAVAELELRLGNRTAAREAFTKSIEVTPRALMHIALGRIDLDEGKVEAARERLSQALTTSEGAAQEVREAAHLAAGIGDLSVAEQLLLTLPEGEDTEDKDVLWREIAAVRVALGKGEEPVKEACDKAKDAFGERFPEVAAVIQVCAISSPKALELANKPAILGREIEGCHRAMEEMRQGKRQNDDALKECQALFEYQTALAQQAQASQAAQKAQTQSGGAKKPQQRFTCPEKPEDRPSLPTCPPENVPWKR